MRVTEAAGVRLQIHQQTQSPFPDTFGYSAPTGFISSFGVRLGCYRSCFQHMLVETCGCADPRFPKPNGTEYCDTQGPGRACLDTTIREVGGFHGITDCNCPQPCIQEVYGVSFSAAVWPADYFELECELGENCVEDYQKNAVLVEIFYEQLNFELMEESPAYGIASLLADFGGQLGLWMGISCITCVEVVVFVIQLIMAGCGCLEVEEVMSRRQQGLTTNQPNRQSRKDHNGAHPPEKNTSNLSSRPLISDRCSGNGRAPLSGGEGDKVMPDDLYCSCH